MHETVKDPYTECEVGTVNVILHGISIPPDDLI